MTGNSQSQIPGKIGGEPGDLTLVESSHSRALLHHSEGCPDVSQTSKVSTNHLLTSLRKLGIQYTGGETVIILAFQARGGGSTPSQCNFLSFLFPSHYEARTALFTVL